MRRKSFEKADCPVARSLDVIGDWWSLLVMRDALSGVRRFSEFERSLGLAKNILSTRLRELVSRGILLQVPASDGSRYQEYVPTPKGERLLPVIIALAQWGSENLYEPEEARTCPIDRKNGRSLARLAVMSDDGREVGPSDISSVLR